MHLLFHWLIPIIGLMRIPRKQIINCNLCYDAACSKACDKGVDPAKKLFQIWFKNEAVATIWFDGSSCASCDAPCMKACPKDVDIKKTLCNLGELSPKSKALTDDDYKRLRTRICGFPLENPFLLSSSVVASNYDMCARAFEAGWAGVVFKTISLIDIHEASPRFSAVKDSEGFNAFRNIEQLSDHSLVENLKCFSELKKNYPDKALVVSIMGRTEEEWEFLAYSVSRAGADVVELNFSCPNMVEEGTGSATGQNANLVKKYTEAARRGTNKPILAKLTPNVSSMSVAAEAAIEGGADGLAAINTIKSVTAVDRQLHKMAVGGLSGNSVKPIAMRFISEIAKNEKCKGKPISAMGGIETWNDAGQFIGLGAENLQITTAVMQYGYRIIDELKDGLALFLKDANTDIEHFKGYTINTVVDVEDVERDIKILPKFIRSKCVGCGRCYVSCADGGHQAIKFDNSKPVLDANKCVGCHLCVLVCPENAIVSSEIKLPIKQK